MTVAGQEFSAADTGMRPAGLELWLVDLQASTVALEAVETATPRLSQSDLLRLTEFKSSAVRAERRASYIALRVLIERMFGAAWRRVPFSITHSGKPVLPDIDGAFSLSHADNMALIGLSRHGAIGVDLERSRTMRLSRARRSRIEAAGRSIAPGAPLPGALDARLLQSWVRIEALAKAEGGGLARVLQRYGIVGEPISEPVAPCMLVSDLDLGGDLYGAVAVEAGLCPQPHLPFPTNGDGIERVAACDEPFPH